MIDLKEFYKYVFSWLNKPIYYSTCCNRVYDYESGQSCPECNNPTIPDLQQTIENYNHYYEENWRNE